MVNRWQNLRFSICAALLVVGTVLLHALGHGEPKLQRQLLAQFPSSIGYRTSSDVPITDRILKAVGVDDYLNRTYLEAGEVPISLYVGYYKSQRTGDTIHSPKNCLPGAGWEPLKSGELIVPMANGQSMKVNEYLIAKGLDRQLVIYWYQSRGRVIASEYQAKFWMIADAVSRNRTDGALVRLIAPASVNEENARKQLVKFAQQIEPQMHEYVPN